jgi:hypothetical protein
VPIGSTLRTASAAFGLIATTVLYFGCAGSKLSNDQYYAVTAQSTDFFRYGPQQGNGPDQKLPRDTLMTLIHPSFGYAKVKLATGEQGYVASEDIRVAPAALIASVTATPTPAAPPTNYPEPKLPTIDSTPAVEPTAIPAPPGSRH